MSMLQKQLKQYGNDHELTVLRFSENQAPYYKLLPISPPDSNMQNLKESTLSYTLEYSSDAVLSLKRILVNSGYYPICATACKADVIAPCTYNLPTHQVKYTKFLGAKKKWAQLLKGGLT